MACISPPELTELQLAMALDHDADPEIDAHLRRCEHCQQRAQQLAQGQSLLKQQLFRSTCPAPDSLRDYAFNLLSSTEQATITQHLSLCPYCSRELLVDYVSLPQLSTGTDVAEKDTRIEPTSPTASNLGRTLRLLIANLLEMGSTSLSPSLAMRQVQVDGASSPVPQVYLYQAEEIQISLEFEDAPFHPHELVLVGLVSGIEIHELGAYLWRDGNLIAETPVDATGSFEFEGLSEPDFHFDLTLNSPDLKIYLPNHAFTTI